ncbi:MAG TPA: helix-turn-helix domain-containing protein [Phycisphaerae bacterium]|nr:helix-turn-helix domain-containing protein [Phycisphaerae bacterium]HRW53713.1 helix-turn-helix domain-containing protein [Phycisphaerae bacterium]
MNLLTVKQVALRVGVSERAIWKWIQTGQFPQPIRISRSVRWDEATLNSWIAERTADAQRQAASR